MSRYQKLVNESYSGQPQREQQQQQPQPAQLQSQQQFQHQQQQQQQGPSVGYQVFLYREQLARRKVEYIRLSKAKYFITETLLAKTVRNLQRCSIDELKTVNNQLQFKNKLRHEIHRLRRLQSLGIRNASPHMESTELWIYGLDFDCIVDKKEPRMTCEM